MQHYLLLFLFSAAYYYEMLDFLDIKILDELQSDGRLANVELAARVGLSPSPCLARVRALEEAGLIATYVALLNLESVTSTLSVFIQIALEQQAEAKLDAFEKAVADFPEVMECYLMSGDSDYLLRVVVVDVNDFRRFVVERLSKVKGVANIRSSFALKTVKYQTALPLERLIGIRGPASGGRRPSLPRRK